MKNAPRVSYQVFVERTETAFDIYVPVRDINGRDNMCGTNVCASSLSPPGIGITNGQQKRYWTIEKIPRVRKENVKIYLRL